MILFVDDEELLVQLGRKTLSSLGYSVQAVMRPEEALDLVRANPGLFSLVLTDQTMPVMTGLVLAGEIRKIRKDLPVILMTGYSGALLPERIQEAGIRQLLLKPIDLRTLGTAVNEALKVES